MVMFYVYQPIYSGSMYVSLTAFFVSGLLKSPFLRGRTVCLTRGCHAKIFKAKVSNIHVHDL